MPAHRLVLLGRTLLLVLVLSPSLVVLDTGALEGVAHAPHDRCRPAYHDRSRGQVERHHRRPTCAGVVVTVGAGDGARGAVRATGVLVHDHCRVVVRRALFDALVDGRGRGARVDYLDLDCVR